MSSRLQAVVWSGVFGFAACATSSGASSAGQGGDKHRNARDDKPAAASGASVEPVALAHELAKYGAAHKSAEALLVAAQILSANPGEPATADAKSESLPNPPAAPGVKATTTRAADAAAMLEQARALAQGNAPVLALLDKVALTRGAAGGPKIIPLRVDARTRVSMGMTFRGDEVALVAVSGDGDTDLDCWVYDEGGNMIDSDTDSTDECRLAWVPAWTGTFRIAVANFGNVYNSAVLLTN